MEPEEMSKSGWFGPDFAKNVSQTGSSLVPEGTFTGSP